MQKTEKFTLTPTEGGSRIEPLSSDPADQELILELFGGDMRELGRPRQGELMLIIGSLMAQARALGLQLEPKGELRAPVLHLSRIEQLASVEGELRPFAGLTGWYAAHWGLTDLYPAHKDALEAAVRSGEPFDTGKFGAKKEIEYGRLRRSRAGGPVTVTVWCEADDGVALADTVFWRAAGGNDAGDSGADVLGKLGLNDAQVSKELAGLATAAEVGETNDAMRKITLESVCSIEPLLEAMDTLAADANAELSERSARMERLARKRLEVLRKPLGD